MVILHLIHGSLLKLRVTMPPSPQPKGKKFNFTFVAKININTFVRNSLEWAVVFRGYICVAVIQKPFL